MHGTSVVITAADGQVSAEATFSTREYFKIQSKDAYLAGAEIILGKYVEGVEFPGDLSKKIEDLNGRPISPEIRFIADGIGDRVEELTPQEEAVGVLV